MTTEAMTDQTNNALINDLYWNSTLTVDEILDHLEISRHALYSSVSPTEAGVSCTVCGGTLVFPNRTSRAGGRATCEGCGLESELQMDEPAGNGAADASTMAFERWRGDLAAVEPRRMALVGGAAALGVMMGAAAVRNLRS